MYSYFQEVISMLQLFWCFMSNPLPESLVRDLAITGTLKPRGWSGD